MKLMMIRTYFGIASIIAPSKTGRKSFSLFQKVRKKDIRRREKDFYKQATTFKVETENEAVDCYELGTQDGPLVFLVHGWDSNAGSMTQFSNEFVEKGYRVIALNLPGHAFHNSDSTNLVECRNAMLNVIDFIAPTEPFSIVSHSFGSAVVANALSDTDYKIDKLVYLSSPNRVEDIFKEFKTIIGLGNRAYKKMVKITAGLIGGPIDMLNVDANLKRVNFKQLLIIHDANDQILPFKNSFDINSEIKNSQLITMERIGHYRMLWNEEVVGRAISFVEGKEVL